MDVSSQSVAPSAQNPNFSDDLFHHTLSISLPALLHLEKTDRTSHTRRHSAHHARKMCHGAHHGGTGRRRISAAPGSRCYLGVVRRASPELYPTVECFGTAETQRNAGKTSPETPLHFARWRQSHLSTHAGCGRL